MFHDDVVTDSYWIREKGSVQIPPLEGIRQLTVHGEVLSTAADDPTSFGSLGLTIRCDGRTVAEHRNLAVGSFRFPLPIVVSDQHGHQIDFELHGAGFSNFLAWLGRCTELGPLQAWRKQARNRRLRIRSIEAGGEMLYDFSNRASPYNTAFARHLVRPGANLLGYFRADLGIGESVRCMARALDAARVPQALIDLRLPCKNTMSEDTFVARLQSENPHRINIVHVDPPGMGDIDHHHGQDFRKGKYTIGYWAWELPEFPAAWAQYAELCDEIWAPSHFTTDSIAEQVSVPVLAMPHSISFARPSGDFRTKFGLPPGKFLFLVLYDLNSYSVRKNPGAVIEAFRLSGLAGKNASLVIKIHNVKGNEADFAGLQTATASLPGTVFISRTLTRPEVYELESACDCLVSLHRSEGFGLAVAECMYLGKPVIATNWSATAEFLDDSNGCPVRATLVTLDRNYGPYAKGQTWAEPDVTHAAAWMQRLVAEPATAAALGAAARASIEKRFSPEVIGARCRRRLEVLASR